MTSLVYLRSISVIATVYNRILFLYSTDRFQQLSIRMSIIHGELEKLRCDEARNQVLCMCCVPVVCVCA